MWFLLIFCRLHHHDARQYVTSTDEDGAVFSRADLAPPFSFWCRYLCRSGEFGLLSSQLIGQGLRFCTKQSEGKVNAQKAFMTGQLKVKGNVSRSASFGRSAATEPDTDSPVSSHPLDQIMFAVS